MPDDIDRIAGGVPEDPNAPLGDYGGTMGAADPADRTFADIVYQDIDFVEREVQDQLDKINTEFNIIKDPYRVTDVNPPSPLGHGDVYISGNGYEDLPVRLELSENIEEWMNSLVHSIGL